MEWNEDILNRNGAPGISRFNSASIPDLSQECEQENHWVVNHFLNSVLRGQFKEPVRQYAINLIRRVQATFAFYHEARDATLEFLQDAEPLNPKIGVYFRALAHWEVVFLNIAISIDLLRHLIREGAFRQHCTSAMHTAWNINNRIKHHAEDIMRGNLRGDDNVPMWLTQEGFVTKKHALRFDHMADLLRTLAELADDLQDPIDFRQNKTGE